MPTEKRVIPWGYVRASPSGACLSLRPSDSAKVKKEKDDGRIDDSEWAKWRKDHLPPISFPVEGFDHVHGQHIIDEVDQTLLGSSSVKEEEEVENDSNRLPNQRQDGGSPLDAPVGSLKEKWRLLPYFLSLRSLLRQHIDSFDHFVQNELKAIVKSPSACEIRSDHDPKFYLRYEDVWVGAEPSVEEESFSLQKITPFQCRLRDCTYSAPIYVTVRYTRGRQIVVKRNVMIGRMPIMLRSRKCVLRGKTEDQLADLKECPYDPGGYFIIKGVEKAILIQEQLSKNLSLIHI